MDFKVSHSQISGPPDSNFNSQVYEAADNLFILVSADRNLQKFSLINNPNLNTYENLKASFDDFVNTNKQNLNNFSASLVLVENTNLYIFVKGQIKALILRDGQLVELMGNKEAPTGISGKLQNGDRVIVATNQFFADTSPGVVKAILESGSIHTASNSSQIAALLLNAGSEVETPQPVLPKSPNKFKAKAIVLIDKILEKLPDRRINIGRDTIDFETKRKKKKAPLIALMLLILLSVSIVFGFRQHNKNKYEANLDTQLSQIEYKISEAKSLASLDSSRAKKLLLESQSDIQNLKQDGFSDPKIDNLEKDIEDSLGSVAGIYTENPQLYLDLSLVSSGFEGTKIDMAGQNLVVLDKNGRKLVGIELDTKRTEILSGPDYIPDAFSVSAAENNAYVMSRDGVREIGREVALVAKPDGWSPSTTLLHWFSGNLYLLDTQNSQIYRFPGVVGGFAAQENWLANGINVDLSSAKSWTIDGEIWILLSDKVRRFSRGVPQNFKLSADSLSFSYNDIYTQEEFRYLYLLDSQNSRVVVFTKDGNYKAEYESSQLNKATEIVVSEESKMLVFLAEGKLFEIELKHL